MGVFDMARDGPHLGGQDGRPYTCISCDESFDVQYHSCPVCGGYDIRRTKWVE